VLTFFGSGLFPFAPGTVGSLAAMVVGWGLYNTIDAQYRVFLFPLLALISMFGCVFRGDRIEQLFGRKDPGAVVIDEAAGQYVALSVVPWLPAGWAPWLLAFLLFRLLDITKPLGIRQLEKRPAGWGVLLDDVAAGAVAALILLAIQQLPGDLLGLF